MRKPTRCLISAFLFYTLAITGAHASGGGGEKAAAPAGEYIDIKPALITNYGGPGPIHFLKAEMTLRVSKEHEANTHVARHMPQIRHELIMLLSRQNQENLETMTGKEQLRQEALTAVQKIVETETGKKLVEDLLFTNFVIQQ